MLATVPDPRILAEWERTFQTIIRELYTHACMIREQFLSDLEAASLRELADISREVRRLNATKLRE
eukprot:7028676-Heterocapsa_arctica.AAC.1